MDTPTIYGDDICLKDFTDSNFCVHFCLCNFSVFVCAPGGCGMCAFSLLFVPPFSWAGLAQRGVLFMRGDIKGPDDREAGWCTSVWGLW